MILFYDNNGNIIATSTWTLANPATYQDDGYLMISGVGQRPIPDGMSAFPFEPDSSKAMAALADAIQADEDNHYTISDGAILLDGKPVALNFVPGLQAVAMHGMASSPEIVSFFDMTDEQLGGYVVEIFGYSAQQAAAWVLVRNVLRDLARAAGLAKR